VQPEESEYPEELYALPGQDMPATMSEKNADGAKSGLKEKTEGTLLQGRVQATLKSKFMYTPLLSSADVAL
jgi:hypothetical protein